MNLVLSLFPGVGLLDRAFEEHGFCIVRGPDYLWGGDICKFHPPAGRFDGVIGGPPCQCFSSLSHMVRHNGHQPKFGNLIPEFERCVREARPPWFLMEEVPQAPVPTVIGYSVHSFVINNRQFGEAQNRLRRWSFGWRGQRRILMIDTVALESPEFDYAACGGEGRSPASSADPKKRKRKSLPLCRVVRSKEVFESLKRKQGLPEDFDLAPFTVRAKCQAVGNGVPMAMGRAMAKAVKEMIDASS